MAGRGWRAAAEAHRDRRADARPGGRAITHYYQAVGAIGRFEAAYASQMIEVSA